MEYIICNIKCDKHFFRNHAACTAYIKCLFYHYLSPQAYMIYEATYSLTLIISMSGFLRARLRWSTFSQFGGFSAILCQD